MKKIGFIGSYDKIDMIINVAKILTTLGKKILVIDATVNQKAKYVVPAIDPTISYITSFEDIDVAVGFDSVETIQKYLGVSGTLPYDIILVDADTTERIEKFELDKALARAHILEGLKIALDNGEIVGVDIDIAREIAKEMGKELVVKDVAFDSIINEVKTGKADFGAAGISYTDERAKQVDFSINYSTSNQVVVVKNGSNIRDVNNIDGKKIAVQLGSVADTYVTSNFKNSEIVREKKYLAAIQDLKDGKADAVVMDELPAKEMVKNNNDIMILSGNLASDSYGMVVKKGNTKLLNTIDKVLNRLKENGKIDKYVINHTTE